MNRLLFCIFLLSTLFLSSCNLFRQATLASDSRAESLIIQGKQSLRQGENMDAWDAFEMARERDFNRSTTAATYLAGLAAFRLEYFDIAQQRFESIIHDYPRSRYVDDAKYHLALLELRRSVGRNGQMEPLEVLLSLSETARDMRLRSLARSAWRNHLFQEADIDVLETYSRTTSGETQGFVMEALIYRILSQDGPVVAKARIQSYEAEGGRMTPWLRALFPEDGQSPLTVDPRWENPDLLRIALVLPFQLNQVRMPATLSQIPQNQVRPLELYEGFMMAIDEYQSRTGKKIFLKVIDSQRDTFEVRRSFRSLDSLGIQLMVGDIYNTQSRVLSDWAESRGVPQLIPLSPSGDLVEDKRFTFLANPTADTHGRRMAEYASRSLGLDHVYIFTDGGEGTQELLRGFREQFMMMGGIVDTLAFSRMYENAAVDQIPELVRSIPINEPGAGVYLPIMGNEEAASLILNILQAEGSELPVMGSPHFRNNYSNIKLETKARFNLVFSTSYLIDVQSPSYQDFFRRYLEQYGFPPSEYAIQGYDLGIYVLEQLSSYNPALGMDCATFLRIQPGFSTIHLPFHFSSEQSNQAVNLGQFSDLGIIKLN